MAVIVGVALAMQMVVGMGMVMVVFVAVCMLVGMGHAIVGVFMGVGMFVVMAMTAHMIVMDMHRESSLHFSFIILADGDDVKTFIFPLHPPYGLAQMGKIRYNSRNYERRHE